MAGKPDGLALSGWSRGGAALLAALALAGCEGGLGLGSGASGDAPAAIASAGAGPTDVAAPEVFQVSEPGLWDGRPSLGGIWVAHPDVTDPERVRIVNTANGQEVIGALFRRERDLPGPALQVSSDAAEALGMLAGAPATLQVTALRRQEAPAEPAPAETPAESGPAEATPAPAPQAAPDGARAVAEATAAILAGTPATPAAAPAIATTPLDAAAPAASSLTYPFVQLATVGNEAAANQAARDLAAKGLPARVVPVPGQSAWRLLLGPAATEAQQTALRESAAAAGYADAYLVRS